MRWLVAQVQRGTHKFVFISCAVGLTALEPNGVIARAAASLRQQQA